MGFDWRVAGALLLISVGSLAVPILFGPIAIAVFMFLLPGYLLLNAVKIDLGQTERLALSILLSIMISSYAIYWMSMALGYALMTFALFFAVVSIAAGFLWEKPKLSFTQDSGAITISIIVGVFVLAVLSLSLWVPTDSGIIVGGWNYSDYFLHLGVMWSVNNGNFPPTEPSYAGVPLAYHWFIDLHTAIESKLMGIFPSFFSRVDSAVCVALIPLFVYLLARRFGANAGASLLAALLVVFAGGFGYTQLLTNASNAQAMLLGGHFDNYGSFFMVPSMLPGFLLVQRGMTIGIAAFAAIALLVTSYPNGKKRLLVAGILLGMLAPFHYYAFVAATVACAAYFAFYHLKQIASEKRFARVIEDAKNSLWVILPSLALALPFILSAVGRAGSMVKLGLGWLAPKDPLGFVVFYACNFGFAFLLAIPGYFLLKSGGNEDEKTDAPFADKRFLFLIAGLLFLIANLVTFSNTQWDMCKLFMYMMVPICVFAGVAIAWLASRKWLGFVVPLVLLVCCASTITTTIFYTGNGWEIGNADVRAGEWILANTLEGSVFATAPIHNSPVESIGGRLRILGYESWMRNYGLDYDSRYGDLRGLYCEGNQSAIAEYGIDYVYLSGAERNAFGCAPNFDRALEFARVYSADGIEIYKVA